jgi:hypothetical protein
MMKFLLVSRRPDGGSLDRMFYEWAVIHVALMLTTPIVTKVFRRYVQHYGLWDVPDGQLLYPRSPERWEMMADHWVDSYDDLLLSVKSPDYVERMQPHRFSSSSFIIMLGLPTVAYQRPDFRSGGHKLVQFHKKADGLSQDEFNRRFKEERGPAFVRALEGKGLRKYEQSVPADLDPKLFKGSLFERGSIGLYAGLEEVWIDSPDDLKRIQADTAAMQGVRGSEAIFAPGGSFSMIMLERVGFDSVTAEKKPLAAIRNPDSLEASLFQWEKVYQEALRHQQPA